MPQNNTTIIDWRTINLDGDAAYVFDIAQRVADYVGGEFSIEYVVHDSSDYAYENKDAYKAEFSGADFEFSEEGWGNSAHQALIRAVVSHLQEREKEPIEAEKTLNAVEILSPKQLREAVREYLTRSKWSRENLETMLRKKAKIE